MTFAEQHSGKSRGEQSSMELHIDGRGPVTEKQVPMSTGDSINSQQSPEEAESYWLQEKTQVPLGVNWWGLHFYHFLGR